VLVLIASFVGSFGAAFLKAGATRLEIRRWQSLLLNWQLAGGVACYLLSSVFFLMGVRKGELTILYPMVALGYVWTLLWSRMFFGEPFTRNKFMGLGLILLGIVCLGLGNG
jgi:undecaprenyl phosphate-alpha-L-ara4N flippase subunit ArnE